MRATAKPRPSQRDECDRQFPWEEAKCGKKTKFDRIVPLNKAAREVTLRLIEKWPEGPLFRNTRGEAWTKDGLRNKFAKFEAELQQLLQATLPKGKRKRVKFNPYVFRHSFATRWADSDKIDSLHLAAAMGHRDSRMLDKVYAKIRNAKSIGKATRRMWGDDAAKAVN